MGEFAIECTVCSSSFSSEEDYTTHECLDSEGNVPLNIKLESVDEEETNFVNSLLSTKAQIESVKAETEDTLELKSDRTLCPDVVEPDPLLIRDDCRDIQREDNGNKDSFAIGPINDVSSVVNYGRQYSCRLCSKTFERGDDFSRHFHVDHKNYKPYSCPVCGKKFLQKHYVLLHMRVHTGEKPYACTLCPRSYSHKTSYIIHMRIHKGERPFRCNVCGKRCYDKSGLTSHMRSHTKETPYKCEVCDRRFSHSKSLLVHRRNHTGEKPYICSYCGKAFRHWHKHKIHVRLHTGEKPYTCKICGKGFPRNDEVNRHMKSHEGIKSFKCSICGVYCATQASITGHINLHHSDLQNSGSQPPMKTIVQDSTSGILGSQVREPKRLPKMQPILPINILPSTSEKPFNASSDSSSKGSDKSGGSTRVIEITSKDSPISIPLRDKSKPRKLVTSLRGDNKEKLPNSEQEKPMGYREFLAWQERMLAKQGLVVKTFPCNDKNSQIIDSKTNSINEERVNNLSSSSQVASIPGEKLRNALTASKQYKNSSDGSPPSHNPQYLLLSQSTGGNNSYKILVPVNVASSTKPQMNSVSNIINNALPLSSRSRKVVPSSASIPNHTSPKSIQNDDPNRPMLKQLFPQSMHSQPLLLMANGASGGQRMIILPQQGSQQTTSVSGTSPVKVKSEFDPLSTSQIQERLVDNLSIKEEVEDSMCDVTIKHEPDSD